MVKEFSLSFYKFYKKVIATLAEYKLFFETPD